MSASDRPDGAAALGERMRNDPWAQPLGVEYLSLGRRHCRLRRKLAPHILNFQGRPPDGVTFSLADVAFGARATRTASWRSR